MMVVLYKKYDGDKYGSTSITGPTVPEMMLIKAECA